jgi:hypothetical protein
MRLQFHRVAPRGLLPQGEPDRVLAVDLAFRSLVKVPGTAGGVTIAAWGRKTSGGYDVGPRSSAGLFRLSVVVMVGLVPWTVAFFVLYRGN